MIMNITKRNTVQRTLVLDAVRKLRSHPTSAEIYDEVRVLHPSISRATVYRNLAVLADSGEILRIPMPGGADRYDFRIDCHAHAECTECGRIFDIELSDSVSVADMVADDHGFDVRSYALVFSGVCEDCR